MPPPPCGAYPIDLAAALGLAGAANPTIALAREAVQASLAERLQADALLLPTLRAGVDFDLHRGNLETSRGIITNVNRESVYVGSGAAAFGAGTVGYPGVQVFSHLADAFFEPLAARQRVAMTDLDATATRNAVLLNVATRYFTLLGTEATARAVRQSEAELQEVVTQTAAFARTGQGREADADRAGSNALLLHVQAEQADEDVAVAAAELARLLSLDPSVRLRPAGGPLGPVPVVPSGQTLEQLLRVAVSNRPEVGARAAAVGFAQTRLREERVRPFVPLLSVGFSAGGFGGGSDRTEPRFGNVRGRTDFDAFAVWSLENLGLGNLALQRQRRAEVGQAEAELVWAIDRVRREVAEAFGLTAARRQEMAAARRRVETAGQAFRLDLNRSRNLEGRPIEVLNSANLLAAARQDLIRATVGYNQAEFQLFVALGQPPTLSDSGGPGCQPQPAAR